MKGNNLLAWAASLTIGAGCGVGSTSALSQEYGTTQAGLVVHEWGTYTSVGSSEGKTMDGLQHTEEELPGFVHARDPTARDRKGTESLGDPVNQKIETPVLYFHSDKPRMVKIDVRFPKGLISEWYPDAKRFGPNVGQKTRVQSGSMSWEAGILPAATMQMPFVPSDSVWAPSRNVDASGVRISGEDERFIFYRGLGRFEMPIRVESLDDQTVRIVNDSSDAIPAAFLLEVRGILGGVVAIPPLSPHAEQVVSSVLASRELEEYVRDVSAQMRRALEQSGLHGDEAQAMVDTWKRSYFRTPGLRVLYVAPRAWTDALLPIQIDPKPGELIRTLVGRIEVMTRAEERAIVDDVVAAARAQTGVPPAKYGRFAEAKLRRAVELIDDPGLKAYALSLVTAAQGEP